MAPEDARQQPAPPDREDLFSLDRLLTEEEGLIHDAAAACAADQLATRVLRAHRHEIFHWEIISEVGAIGLQGRLRLGRRMDESTARSELIALTKHDACGKALDIARQSRDMPGGTGVFDDGGVRHVMNLKAGAADEGALESGALILGRAQTGLQAFQ